MGNSRDVMAENIRIGIRFTEKLANELHQAASAKSRGRYESARKSWENAQQMLDTFIQETGIEEYINAGIEAPAAAVEPEGEPVAEDTGSKKKAPKGAGTRKRTSGGAERSNKGKASDGGAAGSGSDSGGAAE